MPGKLFPYFYVNSLAFRSAFRQKLTMSRAFAACVAVLAFAFVLTACQGTIDTAPAPGSSTRLTPNPDHIYIAPFDTSTGKWIIAREGVDQMNFKEDFQTQWTHILTDRLMKLAPTEPRWMDELPDHGWLVAGQFITVDQGSRFLRASLGDGMGRTTLQMQVYVYDLSVSKTQYLLSFRTGVPNPQTGNGAGSGNGLSGLTSGVEPVSTAFGIGSGLKEDSTRTADAIANVLAQYK